MRARFILLALPALLAGCDLLGIETASQIEAKKEAEGRAIGSACRQAVRSIEDCYAQNPRGHKAAVFAGWREMDQYMRENNIAGMPYAERKLPMITEGADEVPPTAQDKAQAPAAGTVPTAARPAATPGAAPNAARAITTLPGVTPRPNIAPAPQAPGAAPARATPAPRNG